ncbi:hypothetical protein FH972_001006 [Carpinus fangiana]|uniref:Uncharacterized protein n=1 Tax=Carpinus fangiana TaxID=176857 RepID=A0A5N6QAE7_9ROSI|nr:hypothetical protein FH972_001006 [Carpinus fangiana]
MPAGLTPAPALSTDPAVGLRQWRFWSGQGNIDFTPAPALLTHPAVGLRQRQMVGQKKYRWLKDENERLQGKHGYGSCSIRMQMENTINELL